MTSDKKTRKKA